MRRYMPTQQSCPVFILHANFHLAPGRGLGTLEQDLRYWYATVPTALALAASTGFSS